MSADTSKNIIKYTSRDYQSILDDFFEMVPKLTELWKPEADADPGVVLGKFLASAADMLGVNLDYLANEIFAPSVSQRKNAEKLFGLIGYDLGFYTAARTEVTFTNNSDYDISIDFGFNGSNFATLNAYTDITNQSRVITYNILPLTNKYGSKDSRSRRTVVTENIDVFADTDSVKLKPTESVTRVAIEGELKSVSYSVNKIKDNNYIITLPSQHVDTTAIWVKARASQNSDDFLTTQWIQCASPAEFVQPEPRFAVTYDNYSNAQVQISNYLNQLENYDNNWLTIYWIDCSGVIGCVGEDVLSNLILAKPGQSIGDTSGDLVMSNLSNTVELPHTYAVTGKSPETAKEAYYNSRNFINTWDSLVTLPDYNRFLNREPGVDCGIVIDCQKALDYNMSIYNDDNLTSSQKTKKYITNYDFPAGPPIYDWKNVLDLGFDPTYPNKFVFAANFKTYTAMCFAIHNDFKNTSYGQGQVSNAQISKSTKFIRYKPPYQFIDLVKRDYRPLQSMSVEIEFGYMRIFNWHVCGQIYPYKPLSKDVAATIVAKAKEALAMYFAPAARSVGQLPTYSEVIDVVEHCDSRIMHFDLGSPGTKNYGIVWTDCDIDYFNLISFARYNDPGTSIDNIIVAPNYIIK